MQAKLESITNSRLFINVSTAIILLYSVVLGIKTFDEVAIPYESLLAYLDNAITIYFVIEIALRMLSYKNKLHFFKSGWNIFDFVIVGVTLIPFSHSEFALAMRVLRVFRVLRIITVRPQLKELIEVLIKATPAFVDIVILLFIVFYIYAIIGAFIFADVPSGLWKNFGYAMLTLFRVFTLEDWTDVMYETMEYVSPWSWIYYVSFLVFAAFIFFNLFIAVIVEEISEYRQQKLQKDIADEKKDIAEIKKQLVELNKKLNKK